MAFFIKTETIKREYLLNIELKKTIINDHITWVKGLKSKGLNIKSGFLIDKDKKPGEGGLLVIECETYQDAETIIKNDPMIKSKIVNWKLNQWIDISEN